MSKKEYTVEVTEVLQKTIKFIADSEQEAVEAVRRVHEAIGGLDYRDHVSTEYRVVNKSES